MDQPSQRPRLVHARGGLSDIMVRANIALSSGRPEQAIRHYTEVLYKLSPAHVCAFLNRSMAYIEERYYELAVVDAYRACIATSELGKNTLIGNERLSKVGKYIRAERLHVNANHKWTRPPHRNIGNGWARSPLASIVVNATPEVTVPNGAQIRPFGTSKIPLVRALDIRAAYRLCGALFMIGGGARMDALGLIDDTRSRIEMSPWESRWFDQLGNEIMNQLVDEVDPNDPHLGQDTQDKRDERMTELKESMKAMTSSGGYGDYSWDPYEPKLTESDCQKQIHAWVETCSSNCSALIIGPEKTVDTPVEGLKPYIELRANRDIDSGDVVLSKQTISNVATSIPEEVEAKRRAGSYNDLYCNGCASLLAVHLQCPSLFVRTQTPTNSDIRPGASAEESSHDLSSAHRPRSLPTPSSPRQGFMFCRTNHLVPTCSSACRELTEAFDNGICRTKIEQGLRQSHFNDPKPRSMTDCKTQCLRDLIFLRHITIALNLGESPLRSNDLKFATSGPNMRGIEDCEVEPWSFISHVVRPIRYIHQLFENTNTDQFVNLGILDGWIINTLLVKINRAMRITKGPRYVKCFGADGMLDTAFGPWDERWEGLAEILKNQEDKTHWIASIDSLFNMIRIADPALGETPNVTVVLREGVNVYAIETDAGPAIKAGEPLLRAAEGLEAPAVNERLHTEDLPGPMEETHDGEEVHSGDTSEFLEEFSADGEDIEDENDADELGGEGMEVDGGDFQLFD